MGYVNFEPFARVIGWNKKSYVVASDSGVVALGTNASSTFSTSAKDGLARALAQGVPVFNEGGRW